MLGSGARGLQPVPAVAAVAPPAEASSSAGEHRRVAPTASAVGRRGAAHRARARLRWPRAAPASTSSSRRRLLAWAGGIALIVGCDLLPQPGVQPRLDRARGARPHRAGRRRGRPRCRRLAVRAGQRHARPRDIGVGVGVSSLALFAATQLYGFIPPTLGLVGFATIAIATALIAIRASSQAVAALRARRGRGRSADRRRRGEPRHPAFVGAVLVATAMLGLRRAWPWPPTLVLLLTAPQMADWLGGRPQVGVALAAIAGYWVVNVLGARSGAAAAGSCGVAVRSRSTSARRRWWSSSASSR